MASPMDAAFESAKKELNEYVVNGGISAAPIGTILLAGFAHQSDRFDSSLRENRELTIKGMDELLGQERVLAAANFSLPDPDLKSKVKKGAGIGGAVTAIVVAIAGAIAGLREMNTW